jgi:hypothetical protein
MTLYTGDTITVKATIAGAITPDSQIVRFYDAGGREVGRYTDPTLGEAGVYTQAHKSSETDTPSYDTTVGTVVTHHNWKCHWQITKDDVVDSEELDIVVKE